ncbi:hypothetical protein LCGC14_0409080 [marine sediment metagenome]|uniref:CMP/dCMP-type deaminase domain-containing protein n=1 Tax=marine sediment metagenome TaxID=412755 RepID=A0A0F9VGL7_9ZZZZ
MRPDWDAYFIQIAKDISTRATCPRASVGAVIVRKHRIISTGYNGAGEGLPHCIDVGCHIVNEHCERATHAEVNAVAQAARFGLSVNGTVLYIWSPYRPENCHNCIQIMKAAGITKVIEMNGKVIRLDEVN